METQNHAKKPIVKALRILTGVIVGIVILVTGTWVLSKVLSNSHPSYYHGQPLEYWSAQVVSADVNASNQANVILNKEIIPELTDKMFHDTKDSKIRLTVISALDFVPWIGYIPYSEASVRRSIAAADLGAFGPPGNAAIPALIQAVQSTDTCVHESAIVSLGKIHSQPGVVIPFLIKYLSDDDLDDEAATALGEFGSLARPAVPKIIPLLHADDDDAVAAAYQALQKIDPVALTNATKVSAR